MTSEENSCEEGTFEVHAIATNENDNASQSGGGVLFMSFSPPRASKKPVAPLQQPVRVERPATRRSERPKALNNNNVENMNFENQDVNRIREQLLETEKQKISLRKQAENGSKTAKVASNRAQNLELKLKALTETKSKAESRTESLEKELSELKSRYESLEQRVSNQGSRKGAHELQVELKSLRKSLNLEKGALEEELNQKSAQLEESKERLQAAVDTRLQVQQNYEHLLESYNTALSALQSKIESIERLIETTLHSLSTAEKLNPTYATTKSKLEHEVTVLRAEKEQVEAELKAHIDMLEPQLSAALSQVHRSEANLASLIQQETEAQSSIKSLEHQLELAEVSLSSINSVLQTKEGERNERVKALNEMISGLDLKLTKLMEENRALMEDYGLLKVSKHELSTELQTTVEKLEALQNEFKYISNTNSSLRMQCEMLQNEMRRSTKTLVDQKTKNLSQDESFAQSQAINEEYLLALEQIRSTVDDLNEKLNESNVEYSNHQNEFELLISEHAQLKEEYQSSIESLAESRIQGEELARTLDNIKSELEAAHGQIESQNSQWSAQLAEASHEKTQLEEKSRELLHHLENLRDVASQKATEVKQLNGELGDARFLYDATLERMNALTIEHDKQVAEADFKIAQFKEATATSVAKLSTDIDALMEEKLRWIERDEEQDVNLERLQTQHLAQKSAHSQALEDLEILRTNSEQQYIAKSDAYKQDVANLRNDLNAAESVQYRASSEIQLLEVKLKSAEANLERMSGQNTQLLDSIANITEKLASQDEQHTLTQYLFIAANEQVMESTKFVKHTDTRKAELEEQLHQLRLRVSQLESNIKSTSRDRESSRFDFEAVKMNLDTIIANYQLQLQEELAQKEVIASELQTNFNRLSELEQQLTRVESDYSSLQLKSAAEIKELNDSLQVKHIEVDALTKNVADEKEKGAELQDNLVSLRELLATACESETKVIEQVKRIKEDSLRDRQALQELQTELDNKEDENTKLREEIETICTNIVEIRNQISSVKESEVKTRTQITEYKEKDDEQGKQLIQLKQTIANLKQRKKELKRSHEKLETDFQETMVTFNELNEKLHHALQAAESLKSDREALLESNADIEDNLSTLARKYEEFVAIQRESDQKLKETQTTVEQHESEQARILTELEEMQAALQSTQEEWEATQLDLSEIQSLFESLQVELSQASLDLELTRQAVNETVSITESVHQLISERDDQLEVMSNDLQVLLSQYEESQLELAHQFDLLDYTETDYYLARTALEDCELEISQSNLKKIELMEQMQNLDDKSKHTEVQIAETQSQILIVNDQIAQMNSDIMQLQELEQEQRDQITSLSQNNLELKNKLDVLTQSCTSLESQYEVLLTELEDARNLLSRLEAANDDLLNDIQESEARLIQTTEDIERSLEEINDHQTTETTLYTQLEAINESIAKKQNETQMMLEEADIARSQSEAVKLRLEELNTVTEQYNQRAESLRLDNEKLAEQIQKEHQTIQSTIDEIESLKSQILFIEANIEAAKARELAHKAELDRMQASADERVAGVRKAVSTELEQLQAEMETLLAPHKQEMESSILECKRETLVLADLHKAQIEERLASTAADTVEIRRAKAQIVHDLKLSKKELERAKDTIRRKDNEIQDLKATVHQSNIADMSNDVLRENLASRDEQIRQFQEEIKLLKAKMAKSNAVSIDAQQAASDTAKSEKVLEELDIQLKRAEAVCQEQADEIQALSEQLSRKYFDKEMGAKAFLRVRAENESLKREKLTATIQLRHAKAKAQRQISKPLLSSEKL